ncbi:hypothetical protein YC2023_015953 [Brassica napus]
MESKGFFAFLRSLKSKVQILVLTAVFRLPFQLPFPDANASRRLAVSSEKGASFNKPDLVVDCFGLAAFGIIALLVGYHNVTTRKYHKSLVNRTTRQLLEAKLKALSI